MKIVQINSFSNGSTGKIVMDIHNELLNRGFDSYVVWGRGRKSENDREIYLNDKLGVYYHVLYSRLTDKVGFASTCSTKRLLKKLDEIKPDIIHLHNIHGYYINIELLFYYIKQNGIKVIWTLHDCWAFTGHCSYFSYVKCSKWKNECCVCPNSRGYPKSLLVDNSKQNYKQKKKLFTGIDNMIIVTPSNWLADLVKKSFLGAYPIEVIYNGIDTDVFKPTTGDFRQRYDLENKKIILGVASVWERRKGLDDFIKLSKVLDDRYKIVLVGLSSKQMKIVPDKILKFEKTDSAKELAEIYSAADVLVNPTYEENYPTVNLEAQACGTPVITYDAGGSSETIKNNNGVVVKIGDLISVVDMIREYCSESIQIDVDNSTISKEYMVACYLEKVLKVCN